MCGASMWRPFFYGRKLIRVNSVSNRYLIPVLVALMIALPVCARQAAEEPSAGRGRMAPPATLVCDRNQLTSYNGQVIAYQREEGSVTVRIQTDWDTIENVGLKHGGAQDVMSSFLLNGQVFTEADWSQIESGPGTLIDGMRVIAWVCLDDKTQPVLDWRPL